jgi:hypothetical protein
MDFLELVTGSDTEQGQQLFFNYKASAILHSPTSQKTVICAKEKQYL